MGWYMDGLNCTIVSLVQVGYEGASERCLVFNNEIDICLENIFGFVFESVRKNEGQKKKTTKCKKKSNTYG